MFYLYIENTYFSERTDVTEAQAHLEAELKSSKKIGINKETHAKLNQVP